MNPRKAYLITYAGSSMSFCFISTSVRWQHLTGTQENMAESSSVGKKEHFDLTFEQRTKYSRFTLQMADIAKLALSINQRLGRILIVHAAISAAPPFHRSVATCCRICPALVQPQTGVISSHMGTGHFPKTLDHNVAFQM